MFDQNWRYVRWNAYDRDIINGKTEAEMPSVSASESIHPDDVPFLAEKMEEAFVTGNDETIEARVLLKGGPEFRWFLLTGRWVDINGETLGIGFGIDITERKAAEDERRKLNRALLATNKCNDALIHSNDELELVQKICDIVVETGGYLMAWIGYAEQNETKTVRPIAHAGHGDNDLNMMKTSWADIPENQGPTGTAIRTGKPFFIDNILDIPALNPWPGAAEGHDYLAVRSFPLKANDTVLGALTIYSSSPELASADEAGRLIALTDNLAYGIQALRDRQEKEAMEAEREKLQSQLLQAQKMEAVGQLAGGIAHDFNNMLTVILGHTEKAIAAARFSPDDLEAIHNAATRSAELTRQLLAFARKQPVFPEVLELNAVVEKTLPLLRRLIEENITFTWAPDSSRAMVRIDPTQIEQVLVNLCINSRDAISDKGTITITTNQLHLNGEKNDTLHPDAISGDYVVLTVIDNGAGIADNVLPYIFEPFFTTKDIGKGTGLGLSTVYGIVKQNDGLIDCWSNPGNGTKFRVYLPLYDCPAAELVKDCPGTAPSKNSKRVLLVEDELTVLNIYRQVLEEAGYQVQSAASPYETIRLFKEHKGDFEILVTDVVMPEMNGVELSERLTAINPKLKTLFISAYTAETLSQHKGINEKINLLEKPFTTATLLSKISMTLQSLA
ncbi:MAG: ATP-binding protein [Chlorobiaceae bacterium]